MIGRLLLTTETPLSLRSGRDKGEAGSLSYIPGTTLLGSLASFHSMLRPGKHDQFAQIFLQEQIFFSNLYPANFESNDLADDTQPVYPLPYTARTCKRFPGFLFNADQEKDTRHGVYDQLIPWALFALSAEYCVEPLTQQCSYQDCHQPVEKADGFYRRGWGIDQIGKPTKNSKGIRMHTGISRQTGTTAEGILYSRQVIPEGCRFWGTITARNEDLLSTLEEYVAEVTQSQLLRMGNNRTRGLGRVAISSLQIQESEDANALAERAGNFSKILREEAEKFSVTMPHRFYLPITLASDVILFDRLLRYQLQLSPDYLAEVWGIEDAELIYQNAGRKRMMGWNQLWGLPKTDKWAITMGSVFLFGLPAEPDFEVLSQMQRQGIGTRRSEGFGQVRVADSFHQEVNPL